MKITALPNFQYLEFSGPVACPFCHTHLISELCDLLPNENDLKELDELHSKKFPKGGDRCNDLG